MNFSRKQLRKRKNGGPGCGKLPNRWINYDPVGKDMCGTRFVAFKTPLRSMFFANRGVSFDVRNIFEIKTLLSYARKCKKQIGLVIDLTATERYYDPQEWLNEGVQYVKIKCFGHSAHNQFESISRFVDAVTHFLRENVENGLLIGVHCTHGINRTGYMICRYMIDVDGWNPLDAIKHFEHCRGYRIERREYRRALQEEGRQHSLEFLSVNYPGKIARQTISNLSDECEQPEEKRNEKEIDHSLNEVQQPCGSTPTAH